MIVFNYWFNFLSKFNDLLNCKVFNVLHTIIPILFFTYPYNLFIFQSMITNWRLIFFFFIYSLLLCIFFSLPHLSLYLSIGNLSLSKIWWWFYDIKYALIVFYFFNLVFLTFFFFFFEKVVFLTWYVLYFIFLLMHWVWEWVFP